MSTAAARKRPEVLDRLCQLLGIDQEAVDAWIEGVHGRTKLPKTFGRLWPGAPDLPLEREDLPAKLAGLRNSEARQDRALQIHLARHFGASPAVVVADLMSEHHRARLDSCSFDACETAYQAALGRRWAAEEALDFDDPDDPDEPGMPEPKAGAREQASEATGVTEAIEATEAADPESLLPKDLAGFRVSEVRHDEQLFRLADALDLSPGAVRAALKRAHHRQRLDNVDFSSPVGPTQELLLPSSSPLPSQSVAPASTARDAGAGRYLAGGGLAQLKELGDLDRPAKKKIPSALPQRPRLEGLTIPKRGQIARCRHRNWLVEAVHAPQEVRRNAAHLVELVCLDDDAPGQALSVLWELELGAYLTEPEAGELRGLAALDPADHFAAYLNTLRWNATTAADAKLFQAPLRAGIHIQPFQLAPLMRALELPRANLFIADDVGLGKTIEAGLVLQELLLRQRVEFVLVVAPASVCLQWREELYKRFGLHFQIYDRAFVGKTRQQRGYKVNPWTTHNRFIISYPLLRRAEYLEPLRAFLGAHSEHGKRRKSLLILDEAHTVAPASGSSYAVDSQITRIAREHLCPRFENRLFLSATPHNGHSNSFSALLELLDPQRFHRASPARAKDLEAVMIRRLKRDIRRVSDGLFPRREVVALTLQQRGRAWSLRAALHGQRPDLGDYQRPLLPLDEPWSCGESEAPELALATMLGDYERTVAPANKRQRLVFANLQKRLLSSISAFYRTLCAHAARFDAQFADRLDALAEREQKERAKLEAEGEMPLLDGEFDRADRALEDEEEERTAAATASLGRPSQRARAQLEAMLELAKQSYRGADARVYALLEWIRQNQCAAIAGGSGKGTWGPRKLLIFTEYTDTKRWLKKLLHHAFEGTERGDERILEIHGALGDDKRELIQRAFNAPADEHPVRVLLATDAAREGINLQGACADLIHFDIPWNPARLEQRNGRIDRTLQPEPEVRCHYFVYADRQEDAVLDAIVRKVDVIRDELGSVGSVIMERIAETLGGRSIGAATGRAIEVAAEPGALHQEVVRQLDRSLSRSDKQLDQEIRRAGTRYSDAVKKLKFEPRLLHHALDVALSFLGVAPLEAVPGPDGGVAYRVPELPPGWESTLDALRRPQARDESLWEWRRAAEPQPVVFEPPSQMTSPGVHLHLHHPFVRRLLDIFTSAGFGAHQLQHMTLLRHGFDGHAYAVGLARVSLFGSGAVRLHDQLVEVFMRIGGDTAEGPLEPVDDRESGQLLSELDRQLNAEIGERSGKSGKSGKSGGDHELSLLPHVRESLGKRARHDFRALWPRIRERAEAAAERAGLALRQRGQKESRELESLLLAQRKQLASELREQMPLKEIFKESERRQSRADLAAKERRVEAIEREILQEPRELREIYEIQLSRIEPVGLIYLWPKVWR